VESEATHEVALDATGPRGGDLIRERSVKSERPAPPWSAGRRQKLRRWIAARRLVREPAVRLRNDDEADGAQSVELPAQLGRDRHG
jgi:hypothetical protein